MHLIKYDFDYGRRALLEKTLRGAASAGVLTSLWPMISKATTLDTRKAYPEELTSIEAHTKGKIKPGDTITADNVEHVEHLLDPIQVKQIVEWNRRIKIVEGLSHLDKLLPTPYLEATLSNQGRAKFDKTGNVRDGKTGKPWIGGNPFPDPQTGIEAQAAMYLNWGKYDYAQYAMREWDLGAKGNIEYQYDFLWCELQVTSRSDGEIFRKEEDTLRYHTILFTAPNTHAGASFRNLTWYDQSKFPELVGYIPDFKRVREYPTTQRFEPIAPGMTFYLSDAWGAGDPMLTWGNYKIVERKPMLAGWQNNWGGEGQRKNEPLPTHGGPEGKNFFETQMELIPEAIVVESEPVKYPRAPVGKKQAVIDARNGQYFRYRTTDRKGSLWKFWESDYAPEVVFPNGKTYWSWSHVQIHDVQTNRMSRFIQVHDVARYKGQLDVEDPEEVYNRFLTTQALRNLA